jgi:ABC-type dipeptide/oligopeptide/nickel transport system ATPase component
MRAPGAEQVLTVRDLTVTYARADGVAKRAVSAVSLDIPARGRVALVGESGSGKTTIALAILGLLSRNARVQSGSIRLGDRELTGLGARRLAHVRSHNLAYIPQDPLSALDPIRTIGHQAYAALRFHERAASRSALRSTTADLLREVEIVDPHSVLRMYPHELSGGMRQRVLIAIALARNPDVVIADEPTTALDTIAQAAVFRVLDRVTAERNAAVLLITHNLGLVSQFCHRAVVLRDGAALEAGDTRTLFTHPAHEYTRVLIDAVPRWGHR